MFSVRMMNRIEFSSTTPLQRCHLFLQQLLCSRAASTRQLYTYMSSPIFCSGEARGQEQPPRSLVPSSHHAACFLSRNSGREAGSSKRDPVDPETCPEDSRASTWRVQPIDRSLAS